MVKIICLANSWKHGERCIAGINPDTGKWIRPICDRFPNDGRVPENVRLIEGNEPALLDILDIPLKSTGLDFDFESENLTIADGKWQKLGEFKAIDLLHYCDNSEYILHNKKRYVTVPYLRSLPFNQRKTLQLIYVSKLEIKGEPNSRGFMNWKAFLTDKKGHILTNIKITDPEFIKQLDEGYLPQNPCLITVGLSMPFIPYDDWDKDDPCWKLIAGVIELSNHDLILVEMQRIGWTIEQGREYLNKTYAKISRSQLTQIELQEFLTYLKSL